eukprot:TRINITY_DN3211_c0_g1_i1.p1 TRINITY_DN3211_c0_g1~~TRINITY_DN3211_c0_g1_i1.p1  ORF type:complete len:646 (-),score=173.01 TRINITY_DN3211_c0_g1_i1:274-2211(-)
MEEIDQIILLAVRQAGCELDAKYKAISDFDTDVLVEICSKCIRTINPQKVFPDKLPKEMSGKFRVCGNIAAALQEMGYNGDIGYQSFLYPNEKDVRNLMMFLVEALPSNDVIADVEQFGPEAIRQRAIQTELKEWSTRPYVARPFHPSGILSLGSSTQAIGNRGFHGFHSSPIRRPTTLDRSKEEVAYCKNFLPLVTSQQFRLVDHLASIIQDNSAKYAAHAEAEAEWQTLGAESGLSNAEYLKRKKQVAQKSTAEILKASILNANSGVALGGSSLVGEYSFENIMGSFMTSEGPKVKGTRFTHQTDFGNEVALPAALPVKPEETQEDKGPQLTPEQIAEMEKRRREEEVEALRARIGEVTDEIARIEAGNQSIYANLSQLDVRIKEEERKTDKLTEECLIKRKIMDLLPEAQKNLAELRKISSASAQRLFDLAQQWEEHRGPLVERIRTLKEEKSGRKTGIKSKMDKIKDIRAEIQKMAAEIREKDARYKQLLEEYNKLPKDINRSIYTRRILEIIKNVRKQKVDIDKILLDTRGLQKEINTVSETLGRTFVATDELVFKEAKKDPSVKPVYKLVISLHEEFDQVINTIREIGSISNQSRDLESQIEQLTSRNTALNMERIMEDLKAVREENEQLKRVISIASG